MNRKIHYKNELIYSDQSLRFYRCLGLKMSTQSNAEVKMHLTRCAKGKCQHPCRSSFVQEVSLNHKVLIWILGLPRVQDSVCRGAQN